MKKISILAWNDHRAILINDVPEDRADEALAKAARDLHHEKGDPRWHTMDRGATVTLRVWNESLRVAL